MQPRREAAAPRKIAEIAPGGDEGLLRAVLGGFALPRQSASNAATSPRAAARSQEASWPSRAPIGAGAVPRVEVTATLS
jgi:hypothetical protein